MINVYITEILSTRVHFPFKMIILIYSLKKRMNIWLIIKQVYFLSRCVQPSLRIHGEPQVRCAFGIQIREIHGDTHSK